MSIGKLVSAPLFGEEEGSMVDRRPPSWQSRCIVTLLRLLRAKRRLASAAAVQERVRELALHPDPYAPTGLGRGIDATMERSAAGWPLYRLARAGQGDVGDYLVFLHGGGFINEIVRAHWKFVADLTRRAGVRCIVPIYPLAPGATARELVPATGELLRTIMENAGTARVIVAGNSAGAGLALAASQWLKAAGERVPDALVLVSSGGDFSVSRPEQAAIAALDPLLDIPGSRETGRQFAGELDVSHSYVSPLNGDFHGLPPMTIFSGTLDLFYPDSIAIAAKARAAGVPAKLYLRRGQPHNYAAMPTPEGRQAREAILRVLAGD